MKVLFCDLDDIDKELIIASIKAKENAFVPVTGFKVGAFIMTIDKKIVSSSNVETGTLAPSICAERNAIFSYIGTGGRGFSKIAICGSSEDTFPCGLCRQVIFEFSPDCEVYIVNSLDDINLFKISELLPNGFRWEK